MFQVGDIVKFRTSIWRGKIGKVKSITPGGFYRVAIPGTNSSTYPYAPSALKLIERKGK